MNILKPFTMPEYLFQPKLIVRRLQRSISRDVPAEYETVLLPWGAAFRVRPLEVIGAGIYCYGIFDLIVSEAIARLLDQGETAADIGANIGQMTSLMRHQIGPQGQVYAFEPHPSVFAELSHNMDVLGGARDTAAVRLHNVALSDREGEAVMEVGADWQTNQGIAQIVANSDPTSRGRFTVKTTTMDSLFQNQAQIHLCKVDVEGHELSVFRGAERLFSERRIRDVVFEHWEKFPSPVHNFFKDHGFTVFGLRQGLLRPHLELLGRDSHAATTTSVSNYVATREPDRAIARFRRWGWQVLRRNQSGDSGQSRATTTA